MEAAALLTYPVLFAQIPTFKILDVSQILEALATIFIPCSKWATGF